MDKTKKFVTKVDLVGSNVNVGNSQWEMSKWVTQKGVTQQFLS